ncbi:hypothetical protein [Plantactinospora sp. B24E8]|uniref:DUF6197 family protein n=1 Tax=Plantactinospora sp. B24E8 TaxID=3153567 RepID=UPI00325C50BE
MKATHNPPTTRDVDLTPADILRCAAIYVQRHGWTRGVFFTSALVDPTPFPPACAAGAICTATVGQPTMPADLHPGTRPAAYRALAFFADYLNDFGNPSSRPDAVNTIGDWNDETSRTGTEVIDALNDAADEWDRQHPAGGEIA